MRGEQIPVLAPRSLHFHSIFAPSGVSPRYLTTWPRLDFLVEPAASFLGASHETAHLGGVIGAVLGAATWASAADRADLFSRLDADKDGQITEAEAGDKKAQFRTADSHRG